MISHGTEMFIVNDVSIRVGITINTTALNAELRSRAAVEFAAAQQEIPTSDQSASSEIDLTDVYVHKN